MANVSGWWDLNMVGTEDHPSGNFEVSDSDLEHIAELIKEGCTGGEIVKDGEDDE